MADAAATPVPAPVAPPVPSTPEPELVLSEEAKAAGFTADDFKHPEYGTKTKSLYTGFQKAGERASKAEKDYHEVKSFINANPKLKAAFVDTIRELQGTPAVPAPAATPAASPEDEPDPEQMRLADLALRDLYLHLGQGDPYKGKDVYLKEWADDVERVLPSTAGTPADRLNAARERIALERFKAAKEKEATPATPPPPPDTTVRSETDRGAANAPDGKLDLSDTAIVQRALKAGGLTSLSELAHLSGAMR